MRTLGIIAACILCQTAGLRAETDPFVRFMAGVEVLRAARDLGDEQKAQYFMRLQEITGISAAAARERIRSLYDNPRQWKKIQDQIVALLDETKESDKE